MTNEPSNDRSSKNGAARSEFAGVRVPPHSAEAEESVLGSILLDPEAINVAMEKLRAEDFYRGGNTAVFAAMLDLTDRRDPIDVITVSQRMRALGTLEQAGGVARLAQLANAVPSAANVGFYAKIVKELSLRRRVIHEAGSIIEQAFREDVDAETFLDQAESRILSVSDYRVGPSFHKVSDIVQESIKIVETLYDRKQLVTGVASGFKKLDQITAGFQPSDLIIIAARPSMGKTSFALNIGQHVGIVENGAVAVFSLEMSKEQLVLRMLCSESKVENSKVRTGHLAENDFPKLVDAASRLAETPIYIDDTPAITVTELRAKCRRLHRDANLKLIIVDYLQLMRSPAYIKSREQEISDISRSLKALAKELSVPVIALSQLNRSVESRDNKRPQMSDLRESGAIEQDADLIMFIYRDEVYNADSPDKGVAEIIISKQRTGPTGYVRLAFSPEFTRFGDLVERDDLEGLPATQYDLSDVGVDPNF